jgi:hypothetical protein
VYYEIVKCQHLKDAGPNDYYLLAHCWLDYYHVELGLPPFLTEEFHIQRIAQGRRIVTNAKGFFKTADGKWVDPSTLTPDEPKWAYENFTVDLKAEFAKVVESALQSQLDRGYSGDHTGDATKPLFKYGSLIPQRNCKPMEGDKVELPAITPAAKEVIWQS